jgi:hypothetical protein
MFSRKFAVQSNSLLCQSAAISSISSKIFFQFTLFLISAYQSLKAQAHSEIEKTSPINLPVDLEFNSSLNLFGML